MQMFRLLFKLIMLSGIWGGIALAVVVVFYSYDLPDVNNVKAPDRQPAIIIQDRNDNTIARYGGIKGEIISLNQMPDHVWQAVVAIEDRRFFGHFGLDLQGFTRAMYHNVREQRYAQGGSTLTQQLAKNLFLSPDRKIKRKAQEAILAVWLERKYNKTDILTAYLNRVYFGAGAYGIDAASKSYFNKSVSKLTLWESAILAGLLKAPSKYSPNSNPKLAKARAELVLNAMVRSGYVTESQAKDTDRRLRLSKTGVNVASGDSNERYFTDWVVDSLDGFIGTTSEDIIVKTTLDTALQRIASNKLVAMLNKQGRKNKIEQAAIVMMTPDGQIKTMIGGKNHSKSQFNRATQAKRQPGSAFKPIVYLTALEKGYSSSTLIEDAPINFGKYRPKNFNNKYNGMVTLDESLTKSLNTVSFRLAKSVGLSAISTTASKLGIKSKLRRDMSLALGASEVSVLEMTTAYSVFANGGYNVNPHAVLEIRTNKGKLLYKKRKTKRKRIIPSSNIYALNSMLKNVVEKGTGRAARLSNGNSFGKTGTSQNFRDAWFVGYTDKLITTVWMGNDNNSSMNSVTGGKYPAMLWNDVMSHALRNNYRSNNAVKYSPSAATYSNNRDYENDYIPRSGGNFTDMLNRLSTSGGN